MLENTKLFFLKEDIFKEFGIEEGEKIYQNVARKFITNLFLQPITVKVKL